MRAVIISSTGDSSVLTLKDDILKPVPKLSEVLVKLDYAGVNFVDIYQRTGLYPTSLPCIAGREGAGIIESLGNEVPTEFELKVGDKVAVFSQGTMAEYVAAETKGVLKLPDSVSTKEGAAIMLQGLTAWTLVRDAHEVKSGDWVLVQAAAGGTGGLIVQMAKHLGAHVIGTVSNSEKAKVARHHGCDYIVNYKEQNVEQEVMKITQGLGCNAVFSGIGQATFPADLTCTRRKGTMVTYGNSSGAITSMKPLDLSKKNIKLVRPTLANYITEREEFVQRSTELLDLVAKRLVKVHYAASEYKLKDLGNAQDDLTGQKTMGKLIVKI
jgi:NADPH2:quinone reductase